MGKFGDALLESLRERGSAEVKGSVSDEADKRLGAAA